MDTTSANAIKTNLEKLQGMDIDKIVVALVPEGKSLDTESLGTDLPVTNFLSLYKRVIKQFIVELERRDIAWSLPSYFPPDSAQPYGSQRTLPATEIKGVVATMLTAVSNKNYQGMVNMLKSLVSYQRYCGFFDKSSVKQHNMNSVKFDERLSRLDAEEEQCAIIKKKTMEISTDCVNLKATLDSMSDDVTSRTEKLISLNKEAERTVSAIHEILNSINVSKGKVDQIYEGLTKIDNRANQQLDLYDEKISSSQAHIDTLAAEIASQKSQYAAHVKTLEDGMQTFSERSQYLDELIGREVGASLFTTFNKRKGEFKIGRWFYAVFATSFLSVIWIYIVFRGSPQTASSSDSWQLFALNTLKCLPAVYLIYFATKQYSLECHFHEEYAFKSAVALTVKAYADLVNDDKNKDQLILQSVTAIQKPPAALSKQAKGKNIEDAAVAMIKKMPDTIATVAKGTSKVP